MRRGMPRVTLGLCVFFAPEIKADSAMAIGATCRSMRRVCPSTSTC